MQPPPTVPATSPFWKNSIFAPRCCGVEPRVCATVATTTRSPRSPASLIMRYNSCWGTVDIFGREKFVLQFSKSFLCAFAPLREKNLSHRGLQDDDKSTSARLKRKGIWNSSTQPANFLIVINNFVL